MAHRTKESLVSHVQSEIKRLNAENGLPFRELLDESRLLAALERAGSDFSRADLYAHDHPVRVSFAGNGQRRSLVR